MLKPLLAGLLAVALLVGASLLAIVALERRAPAAAAPQPATVARLPEPPPQAIPPPAMLPPPMPAQAMPVQTMPVLPPPPAEVAAPAPPPAPPPEPAIAIPEAEQEPVRPTRKPKRLRSFPTERGGAPAPEPPPAQDP